MRADPPKKGIGKRCKSTRRKGWTFPFSAKYFVGDGKVKHIVNWSGGKDSSAMLIRMVEEDMPIDDIVFIEVMATPTLGGELPEM